MMLRCDASSGAPDASPFTLRSFMFVLSARHIAMRRTADYLLMRCLRRCHDGCRHLCRCLRRRCLRAIRALRIMMPMLRDVYRCSMIFSATILSSPLFSDVFSFRHYCLLLDTARFFILFVDIDVYYYFRFRCHYCLFSACFAQMMFILR